MTIESNIKTATSILTAVATQVGKSTGLGGIFGQAATALITGQIKTVASTADLLDKIDKGEATNEDVVDVALAIGSIVGGLATLTTGGMYITYGVTAAAVVKILYAKE